MCLGTRSPVGTQAALSKSILQKKSINCLSWGYKREEKHAVEIHNNWTTKQCPVRLIRD